MPEENFVNTQSPESHSPIRVWLERQGIVKPLVWGYVGLALFMVGDGIELGFLAIFLEGRGFSPASIATLMSVYGVVVAISAWLSGALAEAWGPRRIMMTGFIVWAVFEVIFLWPGVAGENYTIMLLAYGIRGIGYPFFAYGFLVWITMETPKAVIGRAVGWYWFASTAGLGVIAAYFAGALIPVIGQFPTMWLSLAFVIAGGLLVAFRVKTGPVERSSSPSESLRKILTGLTVVKSHPKVGVGGVVRIINTLCFYAFPVFLAPYMVDVVGFSVTEWQSIWGTMLLANVVGNVLCGYLGDKIGQINMIAWGGGLACALSVLGLYYVPALFGSNFALVLIVAVVLGLAMAAYVPLSAIVPLLAPAHKAAAVAILNLGAGLSNATGPLLARAFMASIGTVGLMWVIAALYVVGIALTFKLRDPTNPDQLSTPTPRTTTAAVS